MFDKICESPIKFFITSILFIIVSIYIMGGISWLVYFIHMKIFSVIIYVGFGMGTIIILFTGSKVADSILSGIFHWISYVLGVIILELCLVFSTGDFIKIATWLGY